ncbi:hypothetical protein LOK49_LG09G01720 [Camellia lanceoleosa]|uniref:Uncharacterized protein n=1 Tax=Camellia lanceoleosa TaxID=1840588 RepID=A0ACC0GIQ5_9ERIC|nr:hypothetical protein LOK49_LG09G01720 [Camellia lanceoleosa]
MIEAIHVNKLNHKEFRKCDDLVAKIIRTYDPRENSFRIGGAMLKFASSDVRLAFGLQCGKRQLDLSPGQRPVSDFIQRRCRDTSRLTSKLLKSQGVDLSGPVNFQVKVDRLRSFEYEREMLGADVVVFGDVQSGVVDCVGGDDAFVDEIEGDGTHNVEAMHTDDVKFGFGIVRKECSSWEGQKADIAVGGSPTDVLRGSTFVKNNEGVKVSEVDEYGSAIAKLELDNKRKDEMIAFLEGEVAGLKNKLEAQAVNIVGGFECVLGIKNEEVDKLKKENSELRRSVLVFEDQLADRDVHVVTQAFRDVDVRRDGVGSSDAGVKVGGEIVYNVSPIRAGIRGTYVCNEGVGKSVGCDVVDSGGDQCVRTGGGFGNVDLCDMDEGVIVPAGQTSFVLTDAGNVVRRDDCVNNAGVIDVDAVVVKGSKWSGFDINNRLGVWKMMTVDEKCRIKQGYDRHGDRAVMWEDRDAGVVVDFSDVKNLIRQGSLCGNVIDGYVELLKSEHARMYGDDELADKSYFFSSVCLDMVKSDDVRGREKFVRTNVSAATDCRFIHFPMCHDGHWTLVVYDTEYGTWKHYNPMRQRGDRADVHHNVATLLKERVSKVMMQTLREFGLDEQSILANFSSSLEAVANCPQQKPGTLDCGVIVCAIMRQYVHRVDVERSLHGSNCIILRANMVKAFVNDPARGLKE